MTGEDLVCKGCARKFSRKDALKRHLESSPAHNTGLTIARLLDTHDVPRTSVTEALSNTDVVYLDIADSERLRLFENRVPKFLGVRGWKDSYSLKDLQCEVMVNIVENRSRVQVWKGDKVHNDIRTAVSVIQNLDEKRNPPQAYITNVPVPSLDDEIIVPTEISDSVTIYSRCDLSANATPKGTFVDLHHDASFGVQTLFGGSKLWLMFPPTHDNLLILRKEYGRSKRFLNCYEKLKGGVFVLQKDGDTLLLPPYILHATVAFEGSFLCGYVFYAIENFPLMITGLATELACMSDNRELEKALDTWIDGLRTALQKGDDATKRRVVHSWIDNLTVLEEKLVLPRHKDTVCDIWKEFVKTTDIELCPCCEDSTPPFGAHMMSQHVEILLERTSVADAPRARQRARR